MSAATSIPDSDETTPAAEPTPTPPRTPAAGSHDWQSSLIVLLAHLEHLRTEMAGKSLVADVVPLLDLAEAAIESCEELASKAPLRKELAVAQSDALAGAGAFYTAAGGIRAGLRKGFFGSMVSALTGAGRPSGPAVRECLLAAANAVHAYFTLFTEQFGSSVAARGWVDAASAFLSEFKQLVRELPE